MSEASDKEVLIFYSRTEQPDLLDRYAEAITCLEEAETQVRIIEIGAEPEVARKHNVVTTPTVIVNSEDTTTRHLGIVEGLNDILQEDMYGKAVLHELGFKSGRELAQRLDLRGVSEQDMIEGILEEKLRPAVHTVTLEQFDPAANTVEVTLRRVKDVDASQHRDLEAFLGGFFTEVFNKGVLAKEIAENNDQHVFRVKAQ